MQTEQRRRVIMNTLVQDYVQRNEVLSSTALVEKTMLEVSSATIRNDLAGLEKEGYVKHLHTSSGRIPTDKGYRFYVDMLMEPTLLAVSDKKHIDLTYQDLSVGIQGLLLATAEILSQITSYPVIVVTESYRSNILKFIQLVMLNIHQVMVVVLNDLGENNHEIIQMAQDSGITQETLNKITETLNQCLSNALIDNVEECFNQNKSVFLSRFAKYQDILSKIMNVISKSAAQLSAQNVVIENQKLLLSFPEFQEIEQLRRIHSILDDESRIIKMFSDIEPSGNQILPFNTVIGKEHKAHEMIDTSLILSSIVMDNRPIAKVGVLGPTRMKYDQVYSKFSYLLSRLKRKINDVFMA